MRLQAITSYLAPPADGVKPGRRGHAHHSHFILPSPDQSSRMLHPQDCPAKRNRKGSSLSGLSCWCFQCLFRINSQAELFLCNKSPPARKKMDRLSTQAIACEIVSVSQRNSRREQTHQRNRKPSPSPPDEAGSGAKPGDRRRKGPGGDEGKKQAVADMAGARPDRSGPNAVNGARSETRRPKSECQQWRRRRSAARSNPPVVHSGHGEGTRACRRANVRIRIG